MFIQAFDEYLHATRLRRGLGILACIWIAGVTVMAGLAAYDDDIALYEVTSLTLLLLGVPAALLAMAYAARLLGSTGRWVVLSIVAVLVVLIVGNEGYEAHHSRGDDTNPFDALIQRDAPTLAAGPTPENPYDALIQRDTPEQINSNNSSTSAFNFGASKRAINDRPTTTASDANPATTTAERSAGLEALRAGLQQEAEAKLIAAQLEVARASDAAESARQNLRTFRFGESILLTIPKDWTLLDDRQKAILNDKTDESKSPDQQPNQVLFAANKNTDHTNPAATVRLSLRPGSTVSQTDMTEMAKQPGGELREAMRANSEVVTKRLLATGLLRSSKVKEVGFRSNARVTCTFTELENDYGDRVMLGQTWVCPTADKTVKLSTSYRKAEAARFAPTISAIWESLEIR